jgi:DNA polymerase
MKNNNSYKLLFNQLWLACPEKISQLNPDLVIGEHWRLPHTLTTKLEETCSPNDQLAAEVAAVKIPPHPQPEATIIPQPITSLIPAVELISNWEQLVSEISNCHKCQLCHGRTNVVIERGNRESDWMFIGEGPGEQEDLQGRSFVGVSGQLLDKMIRAMQLEPAKDIYICNVVKCRPPYNRNPQPAEISACKNYLLSQINLVKPRIIVTLGRFASQTILNTDLATGKLRGTVHYSGTIPVIVTYHPAYLLRNPSAKKDVWQDLQLAMQVFG